jgi:hypothetical protein
VCVIVHSHPRCQDTTKLVRQRLTRRHVFPLARRG